MSLVLSLFPGGGLLDHAFTLEGFTVVRGPDPLWGGDIRDFHPEPGKFSGVIGGPPCQRFSPIGNVNRARYGEDSVMPDLIPEFARVVTEAMPRWFLMECSTHAPDPVAPDSFGDEQWFHVKRQDFNNAWLDEPQERLRRFWFGSWMPCGATNFCLTGPALHAGGGERTVSSKGSVDWKGSRAKEPARTLENMLELQGLPADWFGEQPWTMAAKKKIVGNGVPISLGRLVAQAVKRALPGSAPSLNTPTKEPTE